MQQHQLFIDGKWIPAQSGETFPAYNPATGEVIAQLARGDAADVEAAVQAAHRAFTDSEWSRMHPSDRGRILTRIGDYIERDAERLARLESSDNGRPLKETLNQINNVARWYHYFGGMADKVEGSTVPVKGPYLNYVRRVPLGVCGMITPWNHVMLIATKKIAPALATGNTVVVKPSELACLTVLELAKLAEEAGLPPGVLNIVTGFGPEAGSALVKHPLVVKLDVTGSPATGMAVARAAADDLKRVSCELGGKSPNIVFPDADFDEAIDGALYAAFVAQGQTCVTGSRLLVHRSIYDKFLAEFTARAARIKVGNPLAPGTQMGPQISANQLARVKEYVDIGRQEARLVLGGEAPQDEELQKGYFYTPTVFADVDNSMRIAQEEIFGPVVGAIPFDSDEEAVKLANDVQYGLGAAIWTNDLRRAHNVAEQLRCGIIWFNTYHRADPASPWGGFKHSGYGRENGFEVIQQYTETKSVWVNLDRKPVGWYDE